MVVKKQAGALEIAGLDTEGLHAGHLLLLPFVLIIHLSANDKVRKSPDSRHQEQEPLCILAHKPQKAMPTTQESKEDEQIDEFGRKRDRHFCKAIKGAFDETKDAGSVRPLEAGMGS